MVLTSGFNLGFGCCFEMMRLAQRSLFLFASDFHNVLSESARLFPALLVMDQPHRDHSVLLSPQQPLLPIILNRHQYIAWSIGFEIAGLGL